MLAVQYICKPAKTHFIHVHEFLVFPAVVTLASCIVPVQVQIKSFMGFSYP